jgi:hypothetical protein
MVFQRIKGFYHLAIYFNARANTTSFPQWELVHRALKSAHEGLVSPQVASDSLEFKNKFRECEMSHHNILYEYTVIKFIVCYRKGGAEHVRWKYQALKEHETRKTRRGRCIQVEHYRARY